MTGSIASKNFFHHQPTFSFAHYVTLSYLLFMDNAMTQTTPDYDTRDEEGRDDGRDADQDKSALQVLLETACDATVFAYSGRGMYGEQCLAVTGISVGELLLMVAESAESSDLGDDLRRFQQDSLGRDCVMYFPGVDFISDTPSGYENEEEEES